KPPASSTSPSFTSRAASSAEICGTFFMPLVLLRWSAAQRSALPRLRIRTAYIQGAPAILPTLRPTSEALDHGGLALPHAHTRGGEAVAHARALLRPAVHLVDQGGHDARPRAAQRVPQRDRAPIDVGDGLVQSELAHHRQRLHREGLVEFDEIQIPHAELGARRSEEHTSELQSRENLVCRLLLEK